jgi:hypothetical protein
MKGKFSLFTLALLSLLLFSCNGGSDDEPDTEKPGVTIKAPTEGTVYAIGETIKLSASFTDNEGLKNCKTTLVLVSGNGDGTAWNPVPTNIPISGTEQTISNIGLFGGAIPTCETGTYKLTLEVSDNAEVPNVATSSVNIDIISTIPGLTVTKPNEGDEFESGADYLLLSATCTDNKELKELIYEVTYSDAGKPSLKGATGINDPWEPGPDTLHISAGLKEKIYNDEPLYGGQIPVSKSGNYKLTLKLYDTDGNETVKVINFKLVDAN